VLDEDSLQPGGYQLFDESDADHAEPMRLQPLVFYAGGSSAYPADQHGLYRTD